MSGFQTEYAVVKTVDGRHFELRQPIVYVCRSGEQIVIPIGALSDGASTPWFIWWFLPPFGPYFLPAYLHDWLYRMSGWPKWKCDATLKEAMRSLPNVPECEVELIFEGVRLGGQHAFISDRRERAKRLAKQLWIGTQLIAKRTMRRRKVLA